LTAGALQAEAEIFGGSSEAKVSIASRRIVGWATFLSDGVAGRAHHAARSIQPLFTPSESLANSGAQVVAADLDQTSKCEQSM
jgi:hypothetical protein